MIQSNKALQQSLAILMISFLDNFNLQIQSKARSRQRRLSLFSLELQ